MDQSKKYWSLALDVFNKASKVYKGYKATIKQIEDLYKKMNVYHSEEEAAAAFAAAEIPNTAADGNERSAYIITTSGYAVDSNGYVVARDMYQLTPTQTGGFPPWPLEQRQYIGVGAVLNGFALRLQGKSISLVHTHPSNPSGIPGFSQEDYDWGITNIGCTNVYMGMAGDINGNNVYMLTSSGAVKDPNGNLVPVAQY